MKFFGAMGCGLRTIRLHFGGNPDHDPDTGFLNLDPYPDIFLLSPQLISLRVDDISGFSILF